HNVLFVKLSIKETKNKPNFCKFGLFSTWKLSGLEFHPAIIHRHIVIFTPFVFRKVLTTQAIGERWIERSSRPTHLPIDLTRRQVAFQAKSLAIQQLPFTDAKASISLPRLFA